MNCNKSTDVLEKSKEKYRINIEIPGLPKRPNQVLRRHWSTAMNEKKQWYSAVGLAIPARKRPPRPLHRALVKFGRHSTTPPDYDGLVSSFKWVCDALVYHGILIDDKMSNIGMPEFYWEKAPRKKGFITVEVQEILA